MRASLIGCFRAATEKIQHCIDDVPASMYAQWALDPTRRQMTDPTVSKRVVVPASFNSGAGQAGIHVALFEEWRKREIKLDSRLRGNDGNCVRCLERVLSSRTALPALNRCQ